MKNRFLILLIIVLLVLAGFFVYTKVSGENSFLSTVSKLLFNVKSNDEVVAEVNGEKIYLSDVALHYFSSVVAYKIQKEEIKKNFGEEGLKELSKYEPDPMKSLNSIIDNKLLVQYAKSKGYREDEEYLKNLVSEQKKWFHYELNGLPPDINFDPVSKKLFDEASKLIKDMVRKSGLSEEEFFNKKYIPTLKDAAIVHSMFKDLEKSIKIPEPTEEEIEEYMKKYKGTVTFMKLAYDSYREAEREKNLIEKSSNPEGEMLKRASKVDYMNFSKMEELPPWLKNAIKEDREPTYFEIAEYNGKYYLVCILEVKKPPSLKELKEFIIEDIKRRKLNEEREKLRSKLIDELRSKGDIKILNKEKVINLKNEIP